MNRDFITHIVVGIVVALALGGSFVAYKNQSTDNFSAAPRVLTSDQIGTGAQADYILSTDGDVSTWIENTGGGGGGGGGFPLYVQNDGATLNTATTTLNFTANSFSLVEDPTDTFAIRVATSTLGLLASAISDFVSTVRTSISETITGLTYTSGTGVLSLDSGYIIPTTTREVNQDTAFSWGNHASQGYITDGNTGWDNSYGFITDGNTGWDNSYGLVTATNATSSITNATNTNLAVTTKLNIFGTIGTVLSDFCVAITGGSGLCDGNDATGGSATPAGSDTFLQYNNAGAFGATEQTDDGVRWINDSGDYTLLVGTSSASNAKFEINNQDGGSTRGNLRIRGASASGADYEIRLDSEDADIEFCDDPKNSSDCWFELNSVPSNNEFYFTPRNIGQTSFAQPALTLRRDPTSGEGSVAINAPYDHTPDGMLEVYGTSSISNLFALNSLRTVTGGNVLTIDINGAMKFKPNGAKTYYGDYGSGANVRVGEYTTGDTDVLELFGAQGVRIVDSVTTFFSSVASGIVTLLGAWDFGGATSLEIPNGTNPTVDTVGEIGLDTTDNQLLIGSAPYVIQTQNVKIWSVTIASTSPAFISGGLLKVPTQLDGYTMTAIRCSVQSGTSKVIAVEDESTNSTEDITCATSVTSDDGSITNATATAAEEMYIDFGATTGTVDYVSISVFGNWSRE